MSWSMVVPGKDRRSCATQCPLALRTIASCHHRSPPQCIRHIGTAGLYPLRSECDQGTVMSQYVCMELLVLRTFQPRAQALPGTVCKVSLMRHSTSSSYNPALAVHAWIAPRGSYPKEDREVPEAILGEKIPHTLVTVGMHFDVEILMIRSKLDHLTQSTWKGGTAIFQRTEFTIRTTGVSHSTTIL